MNIKVAALTVIVALGAGEAMAQPGWYREYPSYRPSFRQVPPDQVLRIVRREGLNPVSRPALRGPNYVVQATDRYGELQRVVIDADYGEVVRVRPVARFAPPADLARPMRPGMPRDFDDDEVASIPQQDPSTQWHGPRPRANVPGAGAPRTAAVVPTTPLPRPRPSQAPPVEPSVVTPQNEPAPAPQPTAVTPDAPAPEAARPATPDAARPDASRPDAGEAGTAAAPRVILPGGPQARNEAPAPERKPDTPRTPAPAPSAAPYGIPPAQSLE